MDCIRVVVGGDTVPTKSNENLFAKGETETIFGDGLRELFSSADYTVLNLEAPLYDGDSPIQKNGPNLKASVASAEGLCAINPCAFSLANNHILDHGAEGLASTTAALKNKGARIFGAGKTIEEARVPLVVECKEKKIGILAYAEHEFSIADKKHAGANPFDPLESLDEVHHLSDECDCVLVLYHGGKEHYQYPSPELQRICRKMIEKGANMVVCQHTHCVGCEENYKGGKIVYGQGNFIFDYSDNDLWKTGLVLEVLITASKKIEVMYHPIIKSGNVIRMAEGLVRHKILQRFQNRSKEIAVEGFVEAEYEKLAEQWTRIYLSAFTPGGHSLLFRTVNKLFRRNLISTFLSRRQIAAELNYLECESHRELFLRSLRVLDSKKER